MASEDRDAGVLRRALLGSIVVGLAMPRLGWANELRKMTFDAQVKAAETIVVGRVRSISRDSRLRYLASFAELEMVTTIKGAPKLPLNVMVAGMVPEDAIHCEAGRIYLFLLEGSKINVYTSVNGHHAVYGPL